MADPTYRPQEAPQSASAGLTDAQLRATPVPVSGSFSITGAATETTLAALSTKTPALGQALKAASSPVVIASDQGSLAVTGTFWQGTQPISGTVTVGNASLAVTGSFYQATQPVSIATMPSTPVTGAFWQTTQPVSLTSTTITGSVAVTGPLTDTQLRATAVPVSLASTTITGSVGVTGSFYQATQPVSIAATVAISAASLPLPTGASTETTLAALNTKVTAVNTGAVTISAALPSGTNTLGTTTGPTLTKGSQGAAGYSVQALKDAGRTLFSAATVIGGVTGVTAEALLTMVPTRAGVASATSTSQAVTSGKTLRVVAIVASTRSTAATVFSGRVALRMNPSGAVTATSPIIAVLSMTQQAAALAEAGDTCSLAFPDGLEVSGTQQIGLTQVCSGVGGVVYASIIGYEY